MADKAETSLGTVSRVVTLLEDEALLTRDKNKSVIAVDCSALLLRWAEDYELTKSNEVFTYFEPRVLSSLWTKLDQLPRYAITGSPAGSGIAPPRIAMVYIDYPAQAAQPLGLVHAEAGANVWLLLPYDEVVFTRAHRGAMSSGDIEVEVVTVSAAQAVVDLKSSPGRGPQEAAALVEKMQELCQGA